MLSWSRSAGGTPMTSTSLSGKVSIAMASEERAEDLEAAVEDNFFLVCEPRESGFCWDVEIKSEKTCFLSYTTFFVGNKCH